MGAQALGGASARVEITPLAAALCSESKVATEAGRTGAAADATLACSTDDCDGSDANARLPLGASEGQRI